jgi:hypothetical protein
MCVPCHENTTQRQKLFWFWFRCIEGKSAPGNEGAVNEVGSEPKCALSLLDQLVHPETAHSG